MQEITVTRNNTTIKLTGNNARNNSHKKQYNITTNRQQYKKYKLKETIQK